MDTKFADLHNMYMDYNSNILMEETKILRFMRQLGILQELEEEEEKVQYVKYVFYFWT